MNLIDDQMIHPNILKISDDHNQLLVMVALPLVFLGVDDPGSLRYCTPNLRSHANCQGLAKPMIFRKSSYQFIYLS